MKTTPRLDYERLADALVARGLVSREAAKLVLDQANTTGAVFPEILVRENLVSDWEISRVSSEVFNLPFLPIEVAPPNKDLLDDLDAEYLRANGIVPLERFDDVLTVAMPALVPTAVLKALPCQSELVILPVVGLVSSNRAWLDEHAPSAEAQMAAYAEKDLDNAGWTDIFDAGDEAVQLGLDVDPDTVPPPVPGESGRKIVFDDTDFS